MSDHCLSWCCRKQKRTLNPLDSTVCHCSYKLNLQPRNCRKMEKMSNAYRFPFQQLFFGLMLKATFHPLKLLFCLFRKYTALRMWLISLTFWSLDNSTFRRMQPSELLRHLGGLNVAWLCPTDWNTATAVDIKHGFNGPEGTRNIIRSIEVIRSIQSKGDETRRYCLHSASVSGAAEFYHSNTDEIFPTLPFTFLHF